MRGSQTRILMTMTVGAELGASLGEAIRRHRELAELPMKQLAAMVGISSPYLSQIERGLRAPSDQVLDALAESLKTTADALAGSTGDDSDAEVPVLAAIREDGRLTASQRLALAEVYRGLVEATAARRRRRGRPAGRTSATVGQTNPKSDR